MFIYCELVYQFLHYHFLKYTKQTAAQIHTRKLTDDVLRCTKLNQGFSNFWFLLLNFAILWIFCKCVYTHTHTYTRKLLETKRI